MKRTKMSLKSETVRVLSSVELNTVGGGINTGICAANTNTQGSNSSNLSIGGMVYYTGGCVGWVLVNGEYQYFG